jgi:nucleoside-diphosphate-sugar epimerase
MSVSGRALVTGAAGFIGSRVVRYLAAEGIEVLGIDDLSLGQPEPAAMKGVRFLRADICDESAMRAAMRDFAPGVMVHLAAIHHIPTCEQRSPDAMRVNVVGTQVLLDAARELGVPKLVFASSGAVYDWHEGPLTPGGTPTKPYDTYATSKLANEHQIDVWHRKGGGTAGIARLFNTIGSGDLNGHLIPDIMTQLAASSNGSPRVVRLGNTAPRRDYIFVEDTARGLVAMALTDLPAGVTTLNLGTGVEYGVLDIVDGLAAVLGVEYRVETDPSRMRKIDRLHQCADLAPTFAHLSWRPRHDLREALRLTIGG